MFPKIASSIFSSFNSIPSNIKTPTQTVAQLRSTDNNWSAQSKPTERRYDTAKGHTDGAARHRSAVQPHSRWFSAEERWSLTHTTKPRRGLVGGRQWIGNGASPIIENRAWSDVWVSVSAKATPMPQCSTTFGDSKAKMWLLRFGNK